MSNEFIEERTKAGETVYILDPEAEYGEQIKMLGGVVLNCKNDEGKKIKRKKEIVELIQKLHRENPKSTTTELYCLAVIEGYERSHIKFVHLVERLKIYPPRKPMSEAQRREEIRQNAHLYKIRES